MAMGNTLANEMAARVREAHRMLRSCRLCARVCGVNRLKGERGYCGLDGRAYVFREMMHYGVELDLVPAHALYVAGCNMSCAFCTGRDWNTAPEDADAWNTRFLKERVVQRRREGAKTLFFVGGEPTVSLPAIFDLLAALPEVPTVVWDSNMYMSPETREILEGAVDVYVADFKFGNNRCALEVADAPDYVETVTENILFAERTASLIVRHLLLPGHFDCCFMPVLKWAKSALRVPALALRGEYMPPAGLPAGSALGRYIADGEYEHALSTMRKMGVAPID